MMDKQRLGELIHTNGWYSVYAVKMRDTSSCRVSLELYVVSEDGEMSDLITITRKDFYTKKTASMFSLIYPAGS